MHENTFILPSNHIIQIKGTKDLQVLMGFCFHIESLYYMLFITINFFKKNMKIFTFDLLRNMDALDMNIYVVGIKHELIIYLKYKNVGAFIHMLQIFKMPAKIYNTNNKFIANF